MRLAFSFPVKRLRAPLALRVQFPAEKPARAPKGLQVGVDERAACIGQRSEAAPDYEHINR